MIELLEPILGTPVRLEELKHKPGRRTTSRAIGSRRSAIVKVYASERAPVVAARIGALAAGPSEPVLPEVLLCVPEAHLVVLSEVQGEPLREALLRGDLVACTRAGKAIGAWHGTWVAPLPGPLAPHTPRRELEILHGWIDRTSSDVAPVVRAVLPAISTEEWDPATVVHRDLYEEQVLVGEQIGLIDLDDAALGPPELDMGNLLAHIELLSLRRSTDLTAASECLLDGYRQAGPPLGEALLARCRALTLLRLACIHEDASLAERARPSLEPANGARLA